MCRTLAGLWSSVMLLCSARRKLHTNLAFSLQVQSASDFNRSIRHLVGAGVTFNLILALMFSHVPFQPDALVCLCWSFKNVNSLFQRLQPCAHTHALVQPHTQTGVSLWTWPGKKQWVGWVCGIGWSTVGRVWRRERELGIRRDTLWSKKGGSREKAVGKRVGGGKFFTFDVQHGVLLLEQR